MKTLEAEILTDLLDKIKCSEETQTKLEYIELYSRFLNAIQVRGIVESSEYYLERDRAEDKREEADNKLRELN